MDFLPETIYPFLFIVTGFIFIVLLFVFAGRRWKKMSQFMIEFAQAHGLNFQEPTVPFFFNPSLSGNFRGFSVMLRLIKKGTGKNSTQYTLLELELPQNTGFSFHVYEAGFFSTLAKVFGMQDVEISDPEFDAKFIIQSSDESKIRQLLDHTIKEWFIRSADRYLRWGIRCDGKLLYYEKQGTMSNQKFYDEFADMLNLLCELGEKMKYLR